VVASTGCAQKTPATFEFVLELLPSPAVTHTTWPALLFSFS